MAADIILAPEASDDIQRAYDWYEKQRTGLGEDYLSAIDATISRILRLPTVFPKVERQYRRALARRFPYAVYYEYENNTVTVYCVFHTSRDPNKWRKRLP